MTHTDQRIQSHKPSVCLEWRDITRLCQKCTIQAVIITFPQKFTYVSVVNTRHLSLLKRLYAIHKCRYTGDNIGELPIQYSDCRWILCFKYVDVSYKIDKHYFIRLCASHSSIMSVCFDIMTESISVIWIISRLCFPTGCEEWPC